jgi:hypothetical protein
MKLIGCAGQLRNGKDVTADYLAIKLGWGRGAFASNVKNIFCEAFGVDLEFIEKWKTIPQPPPGFNKPVRQALQFIGDGFRSIKDAVWIENLLKTSAESLIISDIRYKNELLKVKELGGKNILIYRPGFLNDDPNPSESVMKEFVINFLQNKKEGLVKSKGDFELIDFFLINDGTLDDFYIKIDKLVLPYI